MAAAATTTALTGTLTNFQDFNWGPITSLYVPPSTCLSTLTYDNNNGFLYVNHYYQDYYDPSCYPPITVNSAVQDTLTSWGVFYYSPAICPFDWITASTYTSLFYGNGISGFPTDVLPLGTDTTAVLCCPTGFAYDGSNGHECASSALPGETITYVAPSKAGFSIARGEASTLSLSEGTTVYCDGMPVWWQSSDSALLAAAATITGSSSSSSSSSTSSSSSSSSTFSSSSPPSPTSLSTSTGPSNTASPISNVGTPAPTTGLSAGAKVAIGVVIPVAFLALLGGLVWFFRLRKKTKELHELQRTGVPYTPASPWTKESGYAETGVYGQKVEVGTAGQEIHEAPSETSPVELSVYR